MKNSALCLLVLASAVLAGCAHPMTIRPNMSAVSTTAVPAEQRVQKSVGLYISAADRARQVTTKGGGGDSVTYAPYADLESGIYKVLGESFLGVDVVQSPTDSADITRRHLAYVIQPQITTTSSSSGVMTWMATDFSITIDCKITDPAGQPVTTVSATGKGHAPYDEVKHDFNLAGERASADVLDKLRTALTQSTELKK